jgi:hypothetical protein
VQNWKTDKKRDTTNKAKNGTCSNEFGPVPGQSLYQVIKCKCPEQPEPEPEPGFAAGIVNCSAVAVAVAVAAAVAGAVAVL